MCRRMSACAAMPSTSTACSVSPGQSMLAFITLPGMYYCRGSAPADARKHIGPKILLQQVLDAADKADAVSAHINDTTDPVSSMPPYEDMPQDGTPLYRAVPEGGTPISSELVRKVLWSDAHGLFLVVFWGEGVRACLAAVMGRGAGLPCVMSTILTLVIIEYSGIS